MAADAARILEERCRASLAAIEETQAEGDKANNVVTKEWILDSKDGLSAPSLTVRRAHPPHLRGVLTVQIKSCVDVQKISGSQLVSTKVSVGALKSKVAPQKLTQNHTFEDNSFNFNLSGNEDFLRVRLTAVNVIKENCGVAKIFIPNLLAVLCPDISVEMAKSKMKSPAAAAEDAKKAAAEGNSTPKSLVQANTPVNDEIKRLLSVVDGSTLPPFLKNALLGELKSHVGGDWYEAWFRVGKGEKRSEPCGAILLRMKFGPDWSTPALPPPKLTEATASESRATRAEKMKDPKLGRGISFSSPKPGRDTAQAQAKLARLEQLEPSIVKKLPKFFGVTLAQAEQFAIGTQIPTVITDCVNFLKQNGIREEGIFRVPGSNDAIQLLKDSYEKPKEEVKAQGTIALKANKAAGPHEIGGLLKLYLRSLPEPVFPFATYRPLLGLTDNFNHATITDPLTPAVVEQIREVRSLLQKMPSQNLDTVRFLLVFLQSVSAVSSVNLMESKNLAIVFAPTMLRPPPALDNVDNEEMMTDLLCEMPRSINAMDVLIKLAKHIFPNTPPPRSSVSGAAGSKGEALIPDPDAKKEGQDSGPPRKGEPETPKRTEMPPPSPSSRGIAGPVPPPRSPSTRANRSPTSHPVPPPAR